ncbi:NAD(P)-binding protein [Geopyxis carbonaria]|nr:NAD(P)-binding protein [Geopyxis carbonaria]
MTSYAITGASRGIGFEFVNQLSVNPDNHVFALVRSLNNVQALQDLRRPNVHILAADVTDIALLKAAAQAVSAVTGGRLDVLINNAAYMESIDEASRTLLDYEGEDERLATLFTNSLTTNVVGLVKTTNAFLPLLRAGRVKKVLTLSSARGDLKMNMDIGDSTASAYGTAKCAINFVVAKYAIALKDEGFTFLAISPGVVATSINQPSAEQMGKVMEMITMFKKAYPEWDGQPISPETSVSMMLEVLGKAGVERSGEFLSQYGNQTWL